MGLSRSSCILIISSFLLIFEQIDCIIQQELSLSGPYDQINEEVLKRWRVGDSAHLTMHAVHLTSDQAFSKGAIWSTKTMPCSDWEIQVQFNIHGKGVNLFGDGIAIWYTKDPWQSGDIFGSKDYFTGLGVFIDTFEEPEEGPHNHYHPYVSAMVNNGSVQYGHGVDGTYMQLGGCFANVRNQFHLTRIAVSYLNEALMVYLDVDGGGKWRPCFSSKGVYLPTGYYIGVSASTSESPDIHEVIAITTIDLNPSKEVDPKRANIIPQAETYLQPKVFTKLLSEENEIKETPEPKLVQPPPEKPKPPPAKAPAGKTKPETGQAKPKTKPQPSQHQKKLKPETKQDQPKQKPESIEGKPKSNLAEDIPQTIDEILDSIEQGELKLKKRETILEQEEPVVQEQSDEEEVKVPLRSSGVSWTVVFLIIVILIVIAVYGVRSYKRYLIRRQEMLEKRLY